MENNLAELLKKYVSIFLNEYSGYLDREQLEILKSINYEHAIHFYNLSYPLGDVSLNQIYLSDAADKLINTMRNMPNYGTMATFLNNKNYSSYLKYICDNGYDTYRYYADQLMYLIFKMVIKNHSGLIDGIINQEINYLCNEYQIPMANLYKREEVIVEQLAHYIDRKNMRVILFLDKASSFKYLNDHLGYRYAKLVYDTANLIDEQYQILRQRDYQGIEGIVNYAKDYDSILYGNVYNYLLDFSVNNHLSS